MQKEKGFSEADSWGLVWVLMKCQASCVTVVTRRYAGVNTMGMQAFGAGVMLCLWIATTHSVELQQYACIWFLGIVCHRIERLQRWRKGESSHSWYAGKPMLTRFIKDERVGRVVEGAALAIWGFLIDRMNTPCGHFLMASGVSIVLIELLVSERDRKRKEALNDMAIEMESLELERG